MQISEWKSSFSSGFFFAHAITVHGNTTITELYAKSLLISSRTLTRCLNQLAGTGGKSLILFLCWDDFYMTFLTARSSLVFTCRTHVLVRNAGTPAEMIDFHCFGGQKMMTVKLFYSEAFFSPFFSSFRRCCSYCNSCFVLVFLFVEDFKHNLNLFLLYLWSRQRYPARYSILSFLSNDPITRLQNLHYKGIFVYSQISNMLIASSKILVEPWSRL